MVDISRQSSIPLVVDPGVEEREIRVDVKELGFYQALDAVCRAHGEANYLTRDEMRIWEPRHLTLGPRPWVEFPTVYPGDLKVTLVGWKRDTTEIESGRRETHQIELAVHPPPDGRFGKDSVLTVIDLRDGKGRDLRLKEEKPAKEGADREEEASKLEMELLAPGGGVWTHSLAVVPFRREDGLKVLAGRIEGHVAEYEDVKIPLRKGAETIIDGGTCTVVEVTPVKVYSWTETRATLRFKFADPRRVPSEVIQSMGSHDGAREWGYLSPKYRGDVAEFGLRAEKPEWILLRILKTPRAVSIPFRFTDLSFPEGK